MPTPVAKQPQDRKPAASKGTPFTVKEWDPKANQGKGKEVSRTYYLPEIGGDVSLDVPGKVTRAAVKNPDDEQAQMALAFHMIDLVKMPEKVRQAFDSLTTGEMMEVVGRWMGESSGSSD